MNHKVNVSISIIICLLLLVGLIGGITVSILYVNNSNENSLWISKKYQLINKTNDTLQFTNFNITTDTNEYTIGQKITIYEHNNKHLLHVNNMSSLYLLIWLCMPISFICACIQDKFIIENHNNALLACSVQNAIPLKYI